MAVHWNCDYCGKSIFHEQEWVRFKAEDQGRDWSVNALNRMGLNDLAARSRDSFHFHAGCFEGFIQLADDHRRWIDSQGGASALGWQLTERAPRRKPAPREPVTTPTPREGESMAEAWLREHKETEAAKEARQVGQTAIAEIDFIDTATYNSLWESDLVTVEELCERTEAEVMGLPNIGLKRFKELKAGLAALGRSLKPEKAEVA